MAWGYRQKSAAGSMQIDSNFASLAVRYKATLTPRAGGVYDWHAITVACETPVAACRCVNGDGGLMTYKNNGDGTWTFFFALTFGTLTYWIFDRPQEGLPPGWGRRIRHPVTGAVTFDSRYNYIRPVQIVTSANIDTDGAWSTNGVGDYACRYRDIGLTAGRAYAFVPMIYTCKHRLTYSRAPGGDESQYISYYNLFQLVSRDLNGGIRLTEMDAAQVQLSGSTVPFFVGPTRLAASAMLIDVTNY